MMQTSACSYVLCIQKHSAPRITSTDDDTTTQLYHADLLHHHMSKQIRELQQRLEHVSAQLVTRDQACVEVSKIYSTATASIMDVSCGADADR